MALELYRMETSIAAAAAAAAALHNANRINILQCAMLIAQC